MRVAIFGGRGFIGKEFVKNVPKEHEVFLCNRPEVDVTKPETLSKKFDEIRPDIVVNLAAKISTLKSTIPVREAFETNMLGALNVAYAARDVGVRSYIFTSSTVVHGENRIGQHHSRFSPFAPKHAYSASKAAAEYALEQFAKEQDNMNIITLRPPMVIGEGVGVPLPPIEFIRAVYGGKSIEIFGDGDHEREYVSVRDTASGIWRATEWSRRAISGYHPFFLTGNRVSMRELAEKIVKKFGGKIVYTPKTVQTFSLTTNPSDSQKLLDWKIEDDLNAILDEIASFVSSSKI